MLYLYIGKLLMVHFNGVYMLNNALAGSGGKLHMYMYMYVHLSYTTEAVNYRLQWGSHMVRMQLYKVAMSVLRNSYHKTDNQFASCTYLVNLHHPHPPSHTR